jgi:glycosyltransferase involved in cell wall biosynthesis
MAVERSMIAQKLPDVLDITLRHIALLGFADARVERPGPWPRHKPRVSVVIPCYNYGHYIPACVGSVLAQPGVDVDILIVDDASTDQSPETVKAAVDSDPRVHAIYHKRNKGHIATYNEGLFAVDGDYVVLLSADDLLAPGALLRAAAMMEANPSVGLAYGPAVDFVEVPPFPGRKDATSWTIWRGHDWLEDRCRTGRNALRSPEAVMRKSVLHAVGEYKPELPHAGDFEVWMQAASISDVGYVGGIAQAYYRVHAGNMHNVMFDYGGSKGTLVDLQQRNACFVSVLKGNALIPGAPELLDMARRSLAREALTWAIRIYQLGHADRWPVADFVSFAAQVCPPNQFRSLWRALALRHKLGQARSRLHPLFLPSELMYGIEGRLERWRWRQAGL